MDGPRTVCDATMRWLSFKHGARAAAGVGSLPVPGDPSHARTASRSAWLPSAARLSNVGCWKSAPRLRCSISRLFSQWTAGHAQRNTLAGSPWRSSCLGDNSLSRYIDFRVIGHGRTGATVERTPNYRLNLTVRPVTRLACTPGPHPLTSGRARRAPVTARRLAERSATSRT